MKCQEVMMITMLQHDDYNVTTMLYDLKTPVALMTTEVSHQDGGLLECHLVNDQI